MSDMIKQINTAPLLTTQASHDDATIEHIREMIEKIASMSGNGQYSASAEALMQSLLVTVFGIENANLASTQTAVLQLLMKASQDQADTQRSAALWEGLGEIGQGLAYVGQAVTTGCGLKKSMDQQRNYMKIGQVAESSEFIKKYKPLTEDISSENGAPRNRETFEQRAKAHADDLKMHNTRLKAHKDLHEHDMKMIQESHSEKGMQMQAMGLLLSAFGKVAGGHKRGDGALYQSMQQADSSINDGIEKTRKGNTDMMTGLLQHRSFAAMAAAAA